MLWFSSAHLFYDITVFHLNKSKTKVSDLLRLCLILYRRWWASASIWRLMESEGITWRWAERPHVMVTQLVGVKTLNSKPQVEIWGKWKSITIVCSIDLWTSHFESNKLIGNLFKGSGVRRPTLFFNSWPKLHYGDPVQRKLSVRAQASVLLPHSKTVAHYDCQRSFMQPVVKT